MIKATQRMLLIFHQNQSNNGKKAQSLRKEFLFALIFRKYFSYFFTNWTCQMIFLENICKNMLLEIDIKTLYQQFSQTLAHVAKHVATNPILRIHSLYTEFFLIPLYIICRITDFCRFRVRLKLLWNRKYIKTQI